METVAEGYAQYQRSETEGHQRHAALDDIYESQREHCTVRNRRQQHQQGGFVSEGETDDHTDDQQGYCQGQHKVGLDHPGIEGTLERRAVENDIDVRKRTAGLLHLPLHLSEQFPGILGVKRIECR